MKYLIIMLVLATSVVSCNASNGNKVEDKRDSVSQSLPRTIIYKTKADYSNHVPVILNKEKNAIVSYPSKADLGCTDNFAKPTKLNNNYWLDNRGIDENVAFLNFTYEEYCAMKNEPNSAELLVNIMEKNPLVEIIYCAPRNEYNDLINDLNKLVDNNFEGCTRIEL